MIAPNALPGEPAHLTAAWLGSVLDADIASVRVEAVGSGQTGATYRLTPTYAQSGEQPTGQPRSLIAKIPSQRSEVRERVAVGYRAEHTFYTRVAGTVAVPLPHVHLCELVGEGSEFVLLMADLAPAVQGDQIRGCDHAQARLAVEALADLHGPRWCDPAWLTLDGVTMPKADPELARTMGQLARQALDTTLSALGERISAQDRATLDESTALIESWLGLYPERFSLLHGDYRLDNLLFHPDGTSVVVVDWQTITVGLPAKDLAYFVGTGMAPHLRTQAEPELVHAYHRRLLDHDVTDYSAAECWNDYRIGMLQIPFLTTLGYAFTAATDRGDDMVLAMLSRGCHAIRHLDSIELIHHHVT